jgi:DNA-binding MarR family transcriptional regulator
MTGRTPCVCSTLRRAARSVTSRYDRGLASAGLTVTQYALLSRIKRAGAVSLKDLAGGMGMDRTTLTRDLQPLERAGWVASDSGADRRRRLIKLTPAGKMQFETAYPLWEAIQKEMLRKIGKARWQSLQEILVSI